MKILWANSSFLHPTNRGGQIRTLEMLRQLHRRHEIHYAALADPSLPEGPASAGEYSTRAFPFPHRAPNVGSARFYLQVAGGVVSDLPLAISRWRNDALRAALDRLVKEERYDAVVCDFLVTAVNFPELANAVLFEHNVETMIWQRHAENARDPLRRGFFRMQQRRMAAFEADACRRAGGVIAVSEKDAATIKAMFDVEARAVPTGVDSEYFRPPEPAAAQRGLVFVGSMDWLPNIDGIQWFAREVLPRIRARSGDLPVTIVGREPPAEIRALVASDPHVRVTGTVPDVRPYLWEAAVSIVPLRVGGGTRIKIYEAMAAGVPVVSTTIGAEGLDARDGDTIALADDAETFAQRCFDLAGDAAAAQRMRDRARQMVADRFSWERVTLDFERLLVRETAAP